MWKRLDQSTNMLRFGSASIISKLIHAGTAKLTMMAKNWTDCLHKNIGSKGTVRKLLFGLTSIVIMYKTMTGQNINSTRSLSTLKLM